MKFPLSMLRDMVRTELSADELGGLLTMAGFELEGIEQTEGEPVLDVKVMSNRGDGLSVLGLAREVLAKDEQAEPTELYRLAAARFCGIEEDPLENVAPDGQPLVRIETDACSRYACRLFRGIPEGEAPEWVRARLRQAGMRPISLIVDLTNYVMLEVGQPLHAFDHDLLGGGRIVVRQARDGERLTLLNGEERMLSPEMMMICDAERPVAAAGIMGGLETEVTERTQNVLLESAHFSNTSVRRSRKQLGLSTEASYRFERSVDPDGVIGALDRFAMLLAEVDGGRSRLPGVVDVYPHPRRPRRLPLRLGRARRLLGMAVPAEDAERYLTALGFSFHEVPVETDEESDRFSFVVSPPSWRFDVEREEDLVEELGRVHGYEKIPEELPRGAATGGGGTLIYLQHDRIRQAMVALGYSETISHTLRDLHPLDDPALERIGPRNPASPETGLLRNSTLASLADAARRNGGRDFRLFELGRIFGAIHGGAFERRALGMIAHGPLLPRHRANETLPEEDFFSLKGAIEGLGASLGLAFEFIEPSRPDPRFHATRQAQLQLNGGRVGILGQLAPEAAEAALLPAETVAGEIDVDSLLLDAASGPRLRPISRNPSVRRDIAFEIAKTVPFSRVESAVQAAVGDVLERLWLFDVYEGKGIGEGNHSLAVALQLRKLGENFTDEEANQVRETAVAALVELGAKPR